jgi:hypothetical protein
MAAVHHLQPPQPVCQQQKMNNTTYCTAVRRIAETFSSRPNIDPLVSQLASPSRAAEATGIPLESKSAIANGLESYGKS